VRPEHLNDDRLEQVLDNLHNAGLSQVFLNVALWACRKLVCQRVEFTYTQVPFMWTGSKRSAIRFTRFVIATTDSVPTEQEDKAEPRPIYITQGYSRDHQPDLKQFVMDLICTRDGDVPYYHPFPGIKIKA